MLFLDNIIFSLQTSGGISVIWAEILKSCLNSENQFLCIEYKSAPKNVFRKKIQIPKDLIWQQNSSFLPITRYLPVRLHNQKIVFHSSYYRYCIEKSSRNITTVHDFTYEYFFSGLPKTVHCWQKYSAIHHSDVVVCISENTKRDLLRFLPEIDSKKIRVIYNGVSEDYFIMPTSDRLDYSNYILYVGARDTYKNFRFVVEALKDTSFSLAICGRGLSQEEILFLNKKLGQHRYKVFENVDNQTLNQLYNSVFCLAYPSSYEGFGIPVIEAQRAGCPVIALNASSIPEIIGDTPLLLSNLKEKYFIEKLHLLEKEKIREEIIKSGFVNSKRFSWGKMANAYMEIYSEMLHLI